MKPSDPIIINQVLNQPAHVVVLATDTVYGLVARAHDPLAVARLYSLKDRQQKPGTLLAASIDQLVALGLKRRYLKAVENYWPGPVSVLIPTSDPALEYLTQGLPSLAVRLPGKAELIAILKLSGPLLSSSANLPGQPPAENIAQAKSYFKDQVDGYFDGGDLRGHSASTIIRIVDDAIEVIRQGAVVIKS